jgi:hypothetical protein
MTEPYDVQREVTVPILLSPAQRVLMLRSNEHHARLQHEQALATKALRQLFTQVPCITSQLNDAAVLEKPGERFDDALAAAWRAFWQARAQGTALGREVYAAHLQQQHLHLSAALLALECAGELQRLAAAIADMAQVQQQSVHTSDLTQTGGAVVFSLESAPHGAQLLYTPWPENSLQAFDTLEALRQHLAGATLADYFDDGMALATRRNIEAQLKAMQRDFQQQVLPGLSDQLRDAFAAAVDLDTARRMRGNGAAATGEPAVALASQAIESVLKAAADPRTSLALLGAHQSALVAARQQNLDGAATLLAVPYARAGDVAFDTLLQVRIAGWRAEVQLHKALQWLSSEEHVLLEALLDNPHASQRPVAATLQARYGGQLESLGGALLVAAPEALANPPLPGRVFLLWPGRYGELRAFDSLSALRHALCGENAGDEDLILERVQGPAFEHGLVAQLASYQAELAAVTTHGRRYEDAPQLDQSLERLRVDMLEELGLPQSPTRDAALAGAAAQAFALQLVNAPVAWRLRLTAPQRDECAARVTALCDAIHACHQYLADSLIERDVFVQRLVDARLRSDFNVASAPGVALDLPQAVTWVTEIIAGSGAPGTPKRKVPKPSAERVDMGLVELALGGVDEQMAERLHFANLKPTTAALPAGLDIGYLQRIVKSLDVAQRYEDHIWAVYRGQPLDAEYDTGLRREQLTTPFACQLQLQGRLAHFARRLSLKAWKIVECAITAGSAEQYSPDGWTIDCYPLTLLVPGEPGSDTSGFSLGGVCLIQERHSGVTVLHLPDAPNQMIFSEYSSLEAGRRALVSMALDSKMVDYLSTRPWTGDAARHASYINQAMLRNFQGFVSIGNPVAKNLSLAERQADQQMGRLIQAHRASSRSQTDLYFQAVVVAQGNVFNYIKMAMGMVPFVGTGIGLYDAWTAANAATRAFMQGDGAQGVDQLESVLLSLIDAAIDVAPVLPLGRFRSLRPVGNRPGSSASSHSIFSLSAVPLRRFSGYEAAVSLQDLVPGQTGRLRGVYRIGQEHFIARDALVYPVVWDSSYATWRLKGGPTRYYQQPVALDARGHWQTQGAIDGLLVRGGLAGGGAALGRLAQDGWAGLSGYLRRRLRGAETDVQRAARSRVELSAHLQNQAVAQQRLTAAIQDIRAKPNALGARERLEKALIEHRDYNSRAAELMSSVGMEGISRSAARDNFGGALYNAMKRSHELENLHLVDLQNTAGSIRARGPVPLDGEPQDVADYVRQAMVEHKATIHSFQRAIEHRLYQETLFERYQGSRLLPDRVRLELRAKLDEGTSSLGYRVARSTPLSAMSRNPVIGNDLFMTHFELLRERLKNGVVNLFELKAGRVNLSNAQRRRIIDEVYENLRQAKVQAVLLENRYRRHLHWEHWPVLTDDLEIFGREAGELLAEIQGHSARQPAAAPRRGSAASQKKVFETADNRLLIGTQRQANDGAALMEITEPETGRVLDAYRQGRDGRWETTTVVPRPQPQTSLPSLLARAREGLAAVESLVRKVRGYSVGSMDATSLEDILHVQAREFGKLADELDSVHGSQAQAAQLGKQLREQGAELLAEGTRLRVAKLKTSLPTAAAVVYLQAHAQVRIEKLGGRMDIRNRYGKIVDYLQEFQVLDAATGRPLWFAHFHFQKATTPFQHYLAGHLKTAEQRHLGLQWQMAQEASFEEVTRIYRGKIPPAIASSHFAAL